jgi:hypothetical protein
VLLRIDDPAAERFNVRDAVALDGQQVTVVGPDDTAFCRAVATAVGETVIRLDGRTELAAEDRFRIVADGVAQAKAVRLRVVEGRVEQAAFRQRVGDAWGWRCAITGEAVPEVLEAAHLPGTSWRAGDNTALDGILLRTDLHSLLDAGLLHIEGGIVRVSVGTYRRFDGLVLPEPPSR